MNEGEPVEGTPNNEDNELLEAALIDHNLQIMKNSMEKIMGNESIGGSAGYEVINGKRYSRLAVNGIANPETGAIIALGNPQDSSPALQKQGVDFAFLIVSLPEYRILKALTMNDLTGRDSFSQSAKDVLSKTVEQYNNGK